MLFSTVKPRDMAGFIDRAALLDPHRRGGGLSPAAGLSWSGVTCRDEDHEHGLGITQILVHSSATWNQELRGAGSLTSHSSGRFKRAGVCRGPAGSLTAEDQSCC